MVTIPLPDAFIQAILEDSPFGTSLLKALEEEPITSIRVNPRKKEAFSSEGLEPVPWCEDAFYLERRPNFTLDPLFHAGVYYPQEAASMIIHRMVRALNLPEGAFVLDACAAPGGKTLAMFDALPRNCAGIANEIHPHRANILCENITKWGLDNVAVTNDDTAAFQRLEEQFDLILVDAPCSGEGMFRKDGNARTEWNDEAPKFCAERQTIILDNLIHCLKPGGFLLYATCTFNSHENEQQIQRLMDQYAMELHPWPVPEACLPGRGGIGHYFVPGTSRSEGLFVCLLRKQGVLPDRYSLYPSRVMDDFTGLNIPMDETKVMVQENHFALLLSNQLHGALTSLKIPFRFLKKGAIVAEKTLKGWVPYHDLSMLSMKISGIECSNHEALMYLRGETFPIPPYPAGYYVLRHQGVPLGYIKHLGNRFNNLYPKRWRIRMHLK